MTDKNHEQYLEQIETAVAETTMDILEKHSGDLRAMAKLVAEKQVEINRLKEYYNDDKKTIRSLRVKLNEAVDEIECRNSTWESKEGEYECEIAELKFNLGGMTCDRDAKEEEIDKLKEELDGYKEELDIAHFEYDKLKEEKYSLYLKWSEQKEEIKELKSGDKRKLKKKVEELEKRLDEEYSDYDTEVEMRHKAEKELEKLQNEHEGICSKYHADFCELEEKREEVIRLNKFKESAISQVNSHLEQIVELKKENKKLARMVADQTLKVCRLKINEELNSV
jgi:chromosome segregation ATPase